MNIIYKIQWSPVTDTTNYVIGEIFATGFSSTTTSTTDIYYDISMDESIDHVYVVRPYKDAIGGIPQQITYVAPLNLLKLRNLIRADLRDSGVVDTTSRTGALKYKWTHDELNAYIRDAILDFGHRFPKQQEISLTLVAGMKSYVLPYNIKNVSRILYTNNEGNQLYISENANSGESRNSVGSNPYWKLGVTDEMFYSTRRSAGHWEFQGRELSLDFQPNDDDTLTIWGTAPYSIPVFDASLIDIPDEDVEMIKLYACGKATVRVEGQDANLQRWDDTTGGTRADNPITAVTNRYFNAYFQRVKEKMDIPRNLRLRRSRG